MADPTSRKADLARAYAIAVHEHMALANLLLSAPCAFALTLMPKTGLPDALPDALASKSKPARRSNGQFARAPRPHGRNRLAEMGDGYIGLRIGLAKGDASSR